jgi:hypothetical protein
MRRLLQVIVATAVVIMSRGPVLGCAGGPRICDRVMKTTDTCEHVTNGATRTNDYYQEKAENERLSNLVKNGTAVAAPSGRLD